MARGGGKRKGREKWMEGNNNNGEEKILKSG